ncbi:LPXTG cell wall anchor domain-containing protein, partial [uncultured Streptococcus sp.]|uniref:LPXTG cell wall anchor domain-containing protein n=1 Tax=uncultured Streptococcus sp. TaxID=83427 RepID=UPI002596E9CA
VVAPNQTVVGTQNGQLVVQDTSGYTRLADVTEFGGQKNANGTVSFKTADGKMVTLPETGSTSGTLLSLLGTGLLGLVGLFWKKKTLTN